MLACVASQGDLVIKNCITKHLECITAKIIEMGAHAEETNGDTIHVWCDERTSKANIRTSPYPGFPTDLQPQMGVVLSLSDGTSIINESIWESRFQYTDELNKMGDEKKEKRKSSSYRNRLCRNEYGIFYVK